MKEYLLLFRGGDGAHDARQSPELYQKQLEKWKSWMQKLSRDGKLVPGQPLEEGGSVIRGTKKLVTDGPFVEAKETIGGYLVIEARDLQDAVRISKECPILDVDGSVEVRETREFRP